MRTRAKAKENVNSPWILFEAGAISKLVENTKVCPVLFGLDNSDLNGSLTQFQTTLFNKVEIRKLIDTINNSLGDNALEVKVLDNVFETF